MSNSIITDQEIENSLTSNITNRNYQLTAVMKLLSSKIINTQGMTVLLNGLWGSGKSYFVRSLEYLADSDSEGYQDIPKDVLEKYQEKYIILYYNTSEDDHLKNPLGAILARLLNDVHRRKNTYQKDAIEKIKKSIDPKAFIKNFTHDSIDFSKKDTIDEMIDEISIADERRVIFQESLRSIMLPENKKLLFIIDELDRCRPSFALDLIEAVHFYLSNEDTVFLMATNSQQLTSNINHRYGSHRDSSEYLDKYFDLQLTLQPIDRASYLSAKFDHILSVCNAQVEKIAEVLELEPRELDHFARMISLVSTYINIPHMVHTQEAMAKIVLRYYIAPLALGLSIKNHDEYLAIIRGNGREIISKYFRKSPVLIETVRPLANTMGSTNEEPLTTRVQQISDKDIHEGIIKIICDQYEKIFTAKEYNYKRELHGFLDAVSLLGDPNL